MGEGYRGTGETLLFRPARVGPVARLAHGKDTTGHVPDTYPQVVLVKLHTSLLPEFRVHAEAVETLQRRWRAQTARLERPSWTVSAIRSAKRR